MASTWRFRLRPTISTRGLLRILRLREPVACAVRASLAKGGFWRTRAGLEARPTSIQEIGAVQRVALFGNEAGVADDAPQLFFAGVVVRAGGGDHVLLDHDAAHVVATEAQAELAGL